jgi:membrane associated rhomboid family serine protease
VAAPSQRRALGALFLLLTALLAGIAYAAYRAEEWVIVIAAGVLAAWMASLVLRSWRTRS